MAKEKCTQEVIEQAVKLKKQGALDKDIASCVGVTAATFSLWLNSPKTDSQSKLSKAIKKADSDYRNALQSIILKAGAEKDWKAAAWLLERKHPMEYSLNPKRLEQVIGEYEKDHPPPRY